jgi:hypothetical protein
MGSGAFWEGAGALAAVSRVILGRQSAAFI